MSLQGVIFAEEFDGERWTVELQNVTVELLLRFGVPATPEELAHAGITEERALVEV